ncbi:MAG: transporter substrate-binding domain-containing protein [candidate division Zixibacteria bacterium]|nr:transporter substrate-binding domain-containing protein [candidate division Zixibacteria bacterium]
MQQVKHAAIPIGFAVLIMIVLSSCSGGAKVSTYEKVISEGVLRVGTDATYPPFETKDIDSKNLIGFDIDLITKICSEMGIEPEFIVTPFDGIIPGLLEHKYDVIISAMTITPQRAQRVTFSNPYYWASQSIAVRADNWKIKSKDDLTGKRIGVQLGTTGEIVAKRIDDAEVISFENIGAAFIDLANGKVDAVINDKPTTQKIIKTKGGIKIVGESLTSERYGIAVRPADKRLLNEINSILSTLEISGELRQLKDKWFK